MSAMTRIRDWREVFDDIDKALGNINENSMSQAEVRDSIKHIKKVLNDLRKVTAKLVETLPKS